MLQNLRGCEKGVKCFDFAFVPLCTHLSALARVCAGLPALLVPFQEPQAEICVCLHLRAFSRVRLRL